LRDSEAKASARHDLLAVTEEPIDLSALFSAVGAPGLGATASFVGTVRSPNRGKQVSYIDYEGYGELINTVMAEIAAEARDRFASGGSPEASAGSTVAAAAGAASLRVAVVHRLGRIFPGEASLAVVIASVHRRSALEACAFVVEACKERLPVWKLEVTAGGSAEYVAGVTKAAPTL